MATGPQLLLMRHADAAPAAPGDPDVLRGLTAAGRRRAASRAGVVADFAPDVVLCSAARRAVETLAALEPEGLVHGPVVCEDEGLYSASATGVVLRLAELGREVDRAMVVGHLPAVQQVAQGLVAADLDLSFAPAAIAVLQLSTGWSDLAAGTAELVVHHP